MLQPGDCNHCLYCFCISLLRSTRFPEKALRSKDPRGLKKLFNEVKKTGLAKTSCVAFGVTFSACGFVGYQSATCGVSGLIMSHSRI